MVIGHVAASARLGDLLPGVEHGGEADAGAEMLWISADREQRLGRGAEQQVVDHRLVLIWRDIADVAERILRKAAAE